MNAIYMCTKIRGRAHLHVESKGLLRKKTQENVFSNVLNRTPKVFFLEIN
jgi:hypothetical protein